MQSLSQPNFPYRRNQRDCKRLYAHTSIPGTFTFDPLERNSSAPSPDSNRGNTPKQVLKEPRVRQSQKRLNEDNCYAIIFPYICNLSYVPYKESILVRVNLNQLQKSGNGDSFLKYISNTAENLYKFKLNRKSLYGRIISLSDSMVALKQELLKNIKTNPELKTLRAIYNYQDIGILNLCHSPLKRPIDVPTYTTLCQSEFQSLFTRNRRKEIKPMPSDEPRMNTQNFNALFESSNEDSASSEQNLSQNCDISENANDVRESRVDKISDVVDSKKKIITELKMKIASLESRKGFLSEFDTTGSMIRSLIDICKSLLELHDSDELEIQNHLNYFVCQSDPTYKITALNRIFVEGTLPFELQLYEKAVKKARFKNPESFAYQLIKFAFPDTYRKNVILGKKDMSSKELESKINQVKKPLAYVLGFRDPLDAPYEGSYSIELGEKRIRALIDHIFRKSCKLEYSIADEMKVRSRIIKELSRCNSKFKQTEDNHHDDEFADYEYSQSLKDGTNSDSMESVDSFIF